jgi:hypothetical protein
MEIYLASTDDLRRVWQLWEEPPACPAGPRDDAGGSCRPQRRPRDGGQPNRERQARPPGLDGAEARGGCRRQRKRSSSLSGRPTSRRLSAVGGRPIFAARLLRLENLQKRRNPTDGHDLHLYSPPPARQRPALAGTGEREGKEILSACSLLSAQNAGAQGPCICSDILDKT